MSLTDAPPTTDLAARVPAEALVDALRRLRSPVADAAAAIDRVRRLRPHADGLPRPGVGRTDERWAVLVEAGAGDLSVARLLEGHLDARAILDEADVEAPDAVLGVWAADPPHGRVEARRSPDGTWRLRGAKRFCSGASVVDAALVTAHAPDGYRLFLVDAGGWRADGSWVPAGMAASDTVDAVLEDAPAEPVGPPRWYLDRPGFAHGGVGVAAVWHGAAGGTRDAVRERLDADDDPVRLAALGAIEVEVGVVGALLAATARDIDADPGADHRELAHRIRAAAARAADRVLDLARDSVGAGLALGDPLHVRRAADLPVYLVQHHGTRDLAALGRIVSGGGRG